MGQRASSPPPKRRPLRGRSLAAPRDHLAQLRHTPRALKLVWAAAPRWATASIALLAARGVLPVFTVYLTRSLVNALVAAIAAGGAPAALEPALVAAALMGLVLLAGVILEALSGYVQTALAEQTQDAMTHLLQTKAASLDLQFYESPEYYDQLQRASFDAIDRPLALLRNMSSLAQNTITLAAMGGVLLTFAWWMPLALLVSTLPALAVALHTAWRFHVWRVRNTIQQRRLAYYQRFLFYDQAAAEIRLFDLADRFIRSYRALRHRLRGERLQLARQQMVEQVGAGLLGLVSLAFALAWIGWQALQNRFNLGDLAMFYQALTQGQRLMQTLLNDVGEIYRNLLFLDDLFTFLDLRPQLRDPEAPAPAPTGLHRRICFEGVTFRYPRSERVALDDFSLTIAAGQIVAIVGENGAGKSTLLKLLCRLYDPEEGRITWDGVDLRAMALADLRRRITVLFQQPVPYHETAADNIAFGDLAAEPSREMIEQAARAAAADRVIERLPDGYETLLGKWFGDVDLSVGEWQRLALARAFVRQADLVILDEPTSAMDSWAEAAWMARFRELVAGRTALIITHRFTTAMQADVIHVMHAGRVVESGTHDELVALGGRYAESWRLQMRSAR